MYCRKCGVENAGNAKFCKSCGAELKRTENPQENKPSSKKIIYFLIAAVIMAAIAGAIFVGLHMKNEKEYGSYMEMAEKYLVELDYEQAKTYYMKAIEIAPKELEPYVRLARVYVDLEEISKAEEILTVAEENGAKGTEVIESELQELKEEIIKFKDEKENVKFLKKPGENKNIKELPYAPSFEILNKYAKYDDENIYSWKDDISYIAEIGIATSGKIVDETDLYYVVEAQICVPIVIEEELNVGDTVKITVDDITGETEVWKCISKDEITLYLINKEGQTFYQYYKNGDEVYWEGMSADMVYKNVHKGEVAVLKTAKEEIVIANETMNISRKSFEDQFWNCVTFNEKGYIERLMYVGD